MRRRFGLASVVLVGDRGMLTGQRIREDLAPREGLGWITSLRAPTLRALVQRGELKPAQVGPWQLRRLQAKAYPGERVIACRNPSLQVLRTQRRQDLLDATEAELPRSWPPSSASTSRYAATLSPFASTRLSSGVA